VCRYVDLPIQHVAEGVLRRMNRPACPNPPFARRGCGNGSPASAIRTTLLTGFPGETGPIRGTSPSSGVPFRSSGRIRLQCGGWNARSADAGPATGEGARGAAQEADDCPAKGLGRGEPAADRRTKDHTHRLGRSRGCESPGMRAGPRGGRGDQIRGDRGKEPLAPAGSVMQSSAGRCPTI